MDSSISSLTSDSAEDSALDSTAASTDLEVLGDDSIVKVRPVMIEESSQSDTENEEESGGSEGDTASNEEDGGTDEEESEEEEEPQSDEGEEPQSDEEEEPAQFDEEEEPQSDEEEEPQSDGEHIVEATASEEGKDIRGQYREPSESGSGEENNSDSVSDEDDSSDREARPSQSSQSVPSLADKSTVSSSDKEATKPITIYHPFLHGPSPPIASASTSANKENENKLDEGDKDKEKGFEVGFQFRKLVKQLYEQQTLFDRFAANLPDNGYTIKMNIERIKKRMIHLRGYVPSRGEIIEILRQPENPTQSAVASGNSASVVQPLRKEPQSDGEEEPQSDEEEEPAQFDEEEEPQFDEGEEPQFDEEEEPAQFDEEEEPQSDEEEEPQSDEEEEPQSDEEEEPQSDEEEEPQSDGEHVVEATASEEGKDIRGQYCEPSESGSENNLDSVSDEDDSSDREARPSQSSQSVPSLADKSTVSSSDKEATKPITIYHPFLHGPSPPITSASTSANKENENKLDEGDKDKEKGFEVGFQFRKLVKQLYEQQTLFDRFAANLPDNGYSIKMNIERIKKRMIHLRGYVPSRGEIIEILRQPENPTQSTVASGNSASVVQPLRKGLMVHAQAKFLTANVVSSLHNTISSRPTEDAPTDPPHGLKVSLMDHQKTALTFLLWREKQVPRGGILADDMGLGKTLSMISLIMKKKQLGETSQPQSTGEKRGGPTLRSEGTLVVAPLTLLSIWENEIESKLYPGNLSVFRYHGPKRPKDPRELLEYDVVITTYDIIGMEGNVINAATDASGKAKRSAHPTLFHIHWNRIILDEAHIIRNPKSATSEGCCSLDADYRWALTGTPIQNKLKDFYSLIKFLHVAPFDDLRVWKDTIEGRGLGMKRLQAMVSCLVLRRLKEEFESTKLPAKNVTCHKLALNPEERSIYDVLFHFSRDFFMKYLTELGEFDMLPDSAPSLSSLLDKVPSHLRSCVDTLMKSMIPNIDEMEGQRRSGFMILLLLLRLRQCCNHPNLLSTALTSEVLADDDLSLAMGSLSIGATSEPKHDLSVGSKEFFHGSHVSSKVQCIITKLDEIFSNEDPNEPLPNKCIIVSQWTSMLHIIEHHLTLSNISCTKIDGKVPLKDRHANIDAFNRKSPNPRVMLLSLQAGGVGLTLTAANHVFITDLHWNPQLEQQASDRCHRVGQTRTVTIHRFMTENTVERVIAVIQENKLKLASDVLGGSTKKGRKGMGLTLQDLKMLFELS